MGQENALYENCYYLDCFFKEYKSKIEKAHNFRVPTQRIVTSIFCLIERVFGTQLILNLPLNYAYMQNIRL